MSEVIDLATLRRDAELKDRAKRDAADILAAGRAVAEGERDGFTSLEELKRETVNG